MADEGRVELLADALEACRKLEYLGEMFGTSSDWGALGTVRRVLRRQQLLLVRVGLLLRQRPRNEELLQALAREALCESDAMPDGGLPTDADLIPEKVVPGPTPNPASEVMP